MAKTPLFPHSAWTSELVHDYLLEAADTLRRLPSARLKNKLTSWPDVVLSTAEIILGEPRERLPRPPAPDAIDRMDAVLVWLLPLTAEERRIVWARACRLPWRKLENLDGRSHVTLRRIYTTALQKITAARLSEPMNTVVAYPKPVVMLY